MTGAGSQTAQCGAVLARSSVDTGQWNNSRPEASAARNLLAGLWLAGHTGLVLHILAFHIGTLMEVDLYEFLRKWGDTVRGMQPSVSAGRVTPPLATSDASTE